jgi:isopentenyldiphosphate isomerase
MLAYTQSQDEGIKLWIAKRSSTKMSFPGLWDITVSGGIPAGLSVQEGLEKEAEEEAGMSKELLQNAR